MNYLLSTKHLYYLLAATLFLTSFSQQNKSLESKALVRWVVQKSSTLHIAGKTNVAPFGCAISGYYQCDTITFSNNQTTGRTIPLNGTLDIAVRDFNCGNKGLNKDLRKTLKSGTHPSLTINFVALERQPELAGKSEQIKGWIDVALAGVTKRFEIEYSLKKQGSVIHLHGSRTFHFSEFNLSPPQKLGGMIKVKNAFVVDFSLVLQQLS